MSRLRWAWRVWRARLWARAAYFAYQRHPSALNADVLERADRLLTRARASRP